MKTIADSRLGVAGVNATARPAPRLVFLVLAGMMLLFFIPGQGMSGARTVPQASQPDIGIDERLGEYVPLDLVFYDESGGRKTLSQFMDKPVILNLVYYNCPSICNPLMSSIAEVLRQRDLKPAEDFVVITLSFDPTDTPSLAANKKKNYFNTLPPDFPEAGWRFLTGDSANIKALTDAVGFKYKKDGDLFIHNAALIALSPEGKIVRYIYGISFLPFDFKMAALEASEGRVGPTVSRVLLYCFSYDPEGRKYVFNITRVAGTAGLISVAALIIGLTVKGRKSGSKKR